MKRQTRYLQPGAYAHMHAFVPHPNPDWATHVACSICGFAIPRTLLAAALSHGATYSEPAKESK